MNIDQYIQASNAIHTDFEKRVWKIDICHLPKLERVTKRAFNELIEFITVRK